MAKVCIVIVNYNGEKFQNDCIRSLYNMDFTDFELVVIDSGSKDNSIKRLREEFPKVEVILCKENVGVAVGNNIGIKYSINSGAEYTLLLNNDTEVEPHMLNELLINANNNTITVPKIYYYEPNNKLWFAGGTLRWDIASAEHRGNGEIDHGQYNLVEKISYSPTCCMLIHNSIFKKVGFMDEKLFMYFDDTDFCVRIGINRISILYIPTAIIWHKVSSSSGGSRSKITVYYMNRNQLYYINKYRDNVSVITQIKVITKGLLKAIIGPLRKRKNDRFIILAYKDYKNGVMGRKDF